MYNVNFKVPTLTWLSHALPVGKLRFQKSTDCCYCCWKWSHDWRAQRLPVSRRRCPIVRSVRTLFIQSLAWLIHSSFHECVKWVIYFFTLYSHSCYYTSVTTEIQSWTLMYYFSCQFFNSVNVLMMFTLFHYFFFLYSVLHHLCSYSLSQVQLLWINTTMTGHWT